MPPAQTFILLCSTAHDATNIVSRVPGVILQWPPFLPRPAHRPLTFTASDVILEYFTQETNVTMAGKTLSKGTH